MKYYRIGEVAKRLGKSVTTLWNWERDSRIRFDRSPGGHRRLSEADLRALMRETRPDPKSRRKIRPMPRRYWWTEDGRG